MPHGVVSLEKKSLPAQTCQIGTGPAASIPPDAVQNPHGSSDRRPDRMADRDLNRRQTVSHRGENHARGVVTGTIKIENVTVRCHDRQVMASDECTVTGNGATRITTTRTAKGTFRHSVIDRAAPTHRPLRGAAAGHAYRAVRHRHELPEQCHNKAHTTQTGWS